MASLPGANLARIALEGTYTGECNIFTFVDTKDPVTKRTFKQEVLLNQTPYPCGLSFSSANPQQIVDGAGTRNQQVELFIAPDVSIPEGCKIVVMQNGIEKAYKNSGSPSVYDTHQEVVLELYEEWS